MGLIKTIKRNYWKAKLYLYDLGDPDGHIGYATFDIRDSKERERREKAIEREIDKERKYYEKKIKENS